VQKSNGEWREKNSERVVLLIVELITGVFNTEDAEGTEGKRECKLRQANIEDSRKNKITNHILLNR
jgi:hypothetical protein